VSVRGLNWKEACTPFTPPSMRTWWASLDSDITTKQSQCDVSDVIEPIDWTSYEKKIKNKELVAKLKAEYEKAEFKPPADADPKALQAENEKLAAVVKILRKWDAKGKEKIQLLEQSNAVTEQMKEAAGGLNLALTSLIPGLKEEFVEAHLDGAAWLGSVGNKLDNSDFAALAKGIKEGVVWEVHDELPEHIGFLDTKAAVDAVAGETQEYRSELLSVAGEDKPLLEEQFSKMDKEWESRIQAVPM